MDQRGDDPAHGRVLLRAAPAAQILRMLLSSPDASTAEIGTHLVQLVLDLLEKPISSFEARSKAEIRAGGASRRRLNHS